MSPAVVDKEAIRKVVVLVDSLDRRTADMLLERLDEGTARLVRDAWMHLDVVDEAEREAVISEFLQAGAPVRATLRLMREKASGESTPVPKRAMERKANAPSTEHGKPFQALRAVDAEKVVKILADERPQTIALVLAHLPHAHAASILARFSPVDQAEIVRCLVDLEEADPVVVQELDRVLAERLSDIVRFQRRRVAGVSAVAGIVASAEERDGERLLDNLGMFAPDVAGKLTPKRLDFNQFVRFDDVSLGVVFERAAPELVTLALWGAPAGFQRRVLDQLPQVTAEHIEEELKSIGPVRLSDVEEARRRLAEMAENLAIRRKIRIPPELRRLLQLPVEDSAQQSTFVREVG
ncbi:flagellar motor switch protein FliG [Thermostilla marina]